MRPAKINLDLRKLASLVLILVYIALIAILLLLNNTTSFNPPILLLVFNLLFLGLIPLYITYIAYKSFIASGSTGVLLEGTGMLMLGLGATGAGLVNYLPNSMNANVTVQNTGFCIAAFLQFVGILIALSGSAPRQRSNDAFRISLLYGGCIVAFSTFIIAAVSGAVPPFFIQGTGFTALREFVTTSAIEFFVLAAGVLLWLYYKKREGFFFWYSIGMALIGIGLFAVHFPSVLGSPLGWVGRSAQYLGGVYLLSAFITLNQNAQRTGIPVGDMLSRFFGEAEMSYRTLIEAATDAIVVFDSADRVIVWNRAAWKMFGYTSAEAIGLSFFQMVIPDEFTDAVKSNFLAPGTPEADSSAHKSVEITARRKDRSSFPVELALSRHMVAGAWVSTCIIRDLTERKKADNEIRASEEKFRLISTNSPDSMSIQDRDLRYEWVINPALDLTPENMIGKTDQDLLDPEQFAIVGALKQKVMDSGEEMRLEIPLTDPRGKTSVYYGAYIPRRDAQGNVVGILCYFKDITDRKRAEEGLRESEEKFRLLTQNLEPAVALIDEHGAFSIVNPSFLRMFGIPADADILNVNSQDWARWQVFNEDGTPLDVDLHPVRKAALTGRAVKNQLVGLRTPSDTDLKWLLVSAEPILDDYGRICQIICTYYDITDMRKAEEALRDSEATLEAFIDASPGIINIEDEEFRYLKTDRTTPTYFGLDRETIVGRSVGELAPDFIRDYGTMMRGVIDTGKPVLNVELSNRVPAHPDELTYWRASYFRVQLPGGKRGIGIVGLDITDRKRAETALQNNIRLLQDLMDGSTSPIFLKDLDGKFITINSALERMLGKSRQELTGKTDYDIAPKEIADYWRSNDKKIIDTGKAMQIVEMADLPDGHHTFLANKFPLVDAAGNIYGIGAISHDISDRKKAEESLKQKNDELNELNEELSSKEEELQQNLEDLAVREKNLSIALAEKEVLLSEIHHRVKNNLTAFISLLSLEGSTEDTPAGRQLKIDLQNRARSMALVHETLYRTHLFNEVDMETYLRTLLDQIGKSFQMARSVKTVVDARGIMLDIPRATPTGLIINELVTNSFKYSFPESFDVKAARNAPPTISVILTKNDGMHEMIVKDNGIGLPTGFNLEKTQTLGLKLVNFLARHQIRAKIEVHSDHGAEFIFRFKE